jgi:PAS domain S-box-containing protein
MVLFTGIVLSVALFCLVRDREQSLVRKEFEQQGSNYAVALQREVDRNLEVVESIAGLYAASVEVERHEFREFVKEALSRHEEIQALEWVPRVNDTQRVSYEEAARRDGLPDFQFTEQNNQRRMVRAGQRPDYFPVYYIEPFLGNEAALGFDLASDPTRREALEKARDTGQAIATAPVTLPQEREGQLSVLILRPVYRNGVPHQTPEERHENLEGYVLGAFRVGELVTASLQGLGVEGIGFYLYDELAPAGQRLITSHTPGTDSILPGNEDQLENWNGLYSRAEVQVPGRQWSLLLFPTAEFFTAHRTWQAWMVLAVGLLFTGLLGLYLYRWITYSSRTEAFALRLSRANRELEKEITDRKQAEQALRQSEVRFRSVMEQLPQGACVTADGVIVYCNLQLCATLGYTTQEVQGKSPLDFVHPTDRVRCSSRLQELLDGGPEHSSEYQVCKKDGVAIPMEVSSRVIEHDGRPAILSILQDLTDRKRGERALRQSEQKIRERAAELARSNAELEQFAYIASHDLQEPLRSITGFTSLLTRRYQGQLGDDADRFMTRISEATARMQRLINDLLTYSRVGREVKLQPTDCHSLVGQEIAGLQAAIHESGAVIHCDSLPTVTVDPTLLGQLFRNLIGNAIKFRGEEPPKVQISAEEKGDHWVFAVRDNGIGIDPKYNERIFTIFERLHSVEEYPGTGIGLSICKKAVERWGGQIWVESQLGQGSTFYFTVPLTSGESGVSNSALVAVQS